MSFITYSEQMEEAERIKKATNYYAAAVKSLTGREVKKAWFQCQLCDGLGFSQFEEDCSGCDGYGRTRGYAFPCGHDTESEDCIEDDCAERERLSAVSAKFEREHPQLKSLKEVESEREEGAA